MEPPPLLGTVPSQDTQKFAGGKVASITRRSFLSAAPAGLATLGTLTAAAQSPEAHLVWKTCDWKIAAFRELTEEQAPVKQLYDITQIGEGRFLSYAADLGLRLFDRANGGITLTRQCSLLLSYANKVAELVAEAERALGTGNGLASGELRFGVFVF